MEIISSIDVDVKSAFERLGLTDKGEVQIYASNKASQMMEKYVPFAYGSGSHLRSSVDIQPDYVEYQTPYAHYIYEGELYVDPETGSAWARKGATKIPTGIPLSYHEPGTGPHWDRLMMTAEGSDFNRAVRNKVKEMDSR